MTIDLETGELLTLKEVIGPERTVEELTDTGAFHCLQIWGDKDMSSEKMEETDRKQVEEAGKWVNSDGQLIAAIAFGYPNEFPKERPRKKIDDIVEWRN